MVADELKSYAQNGTSLRVPVVIRGSCIIRLITVITELLLNFCFHRNLLLFSTVISFQMCRQSLFCVSLSTRVLYLKQAGQMKKILEVIL